MGTVQQYVGLYSQMTDAMKPFLSIEIGMLINNSQIEANAWLVAIVTIGQSLVPMVTETA